MKTPLGCSWDSPPGSVEPGPAFALGELAARGKRGAAGLAARSPNASAGRFPPTCGPCQTQPGTVCARIKAEPVPWVVVFLFGVGQPQQVVGRAGEEKPTVWGARPRGARGMGIPGQLPPGPFKRRPLPAAAAIAIMLCLLLTVLAHLFPAACGGVHERTFVAVKPDGVQRRLVGEIVRRFERKGFKLVALKLVQVWQGLDVVRASRALMGATDPADAAPGTIRGDFCVEVGKNVIHGSDSVESARREIALWFRSEELLRWEDSAGHWLYE
ncbi:nucleoside diphosphate kinase 3 isoform X5 [Mirounga angustirostris]|uniref:nucleoside diphosphate kinase 3 isoform X5 n=1 Tax=Mirounga angustirostris TaxID=9716 RepID=UPI00313AF353